MKNKRVTAYLLLLLVSVIWGVAGPIIKHTLTYFSPTVFLTYRFFLSSLVALFYFTLYPRMIPKTSHHVHHAMLHSGGVIILGLGLLFFGFNYTDSLTGNLLAATGPLFSTLFGALLLRERVSKHEAVGLGLAMTGSILTIVTGSGINTSGLWGAALIGNVSILLSRMADALGGVATKQALKKGMNPIALTHISFFMGFIFFSILTVTKLGGIGNLAMLIMQAPLEAHLGVAYMAFVSGTFGYFLYNTALNIIELGESSIFTYLTVLWGAPLSVLWLGDKLTPQFLLGASVIALGVFIAEWHRKKKASPKISKKSRKKR